MQEITLVDILLRIRQDMMLGRIAMYLGEVNADRMVGFIAGYRACQGFHGVPDTEYSDFCEWLRVVKEEFPQEGWAAKYLRDCQGDHHAAIKKFLDFVAEFAATRPRHQPGG